MVFGVKALGRRGSHATDFWVPGIFVTTGVTIRWFSGKRKAPNHWYFNVSEPSSLVRVGGLEPPRAYTHCHLKTARLPFRHTRRQVINLPLDCRNVQIGVSRCVARGLARKQRRSLRPLVGRAGSFFTGGGSITPTNVLAPCTDFEVVLCTAQPHVREQAFHRLGTDRAVLVQRE